MESLSIVSVLLGSSWASGINLYLTIAGLGIAHRVGWIVLPGSMDSLANPLVIGLAILMYIIEFFVDKVPYADSGWDVVHTFIRPLGGMILGFLAAEGLGPLMQYPIAASAGMVSLNSHLTKAASRAAINTSPEPVTNSVASVTEDAGVFGVLYLMIAHPVIAIIVVIIFIVGSIWFLKKMAAFLKKLFWKKEDFKTIDVSAESHKSYQVEN